MNDGVANLAPFQGIRDTIAICHQFRRAGLPL